MPLDTHEMKKKLKRKQTFFFTWYLIACGRTTNPFPSLQLKRLVCLTMAYTYYYNSQLLHCPQKKNFIMNNTSCPSSDCQKLCVWWVFVVCYLVCHCFIWFVTCLICVSAETQRQNSRCLFKINRLHLLQDTFSKCLWQSVRAFA